MVSSRIRFGSVDDADPTLPPPTGCSQVIHGLLDHTLLMLGSKPKIEGHAAGYDIRPSEGPPPSLIPCATESKSNSCPLTGKISPRLSKVPKPKAMPDFPPVLNNLFVFPSKSHPLRSSSSQRK